MWKERKLTVANINAKVLVTMRYRKVMFKHAFLFIFLVKEVDALVFRLLVNNELVISRACIPRANPITRL